MKKEEFKLLIESIGFYSTDGFNYYYKEFEIYLYNSYYNFYDCSEWDDYNYNNLKPIEECFKRELRSIKLKALLR